MPAYDPATDSKECSKCATVYKGEDVAKSFFKVQAMKDGYATRCKKCYYVKATPAEAMARNDKVIERKFTKMVEAEPIKDRPAGKKAYSHSDADIKRIEQSSGLKFVQWDDMGDMYMPRFAKAVKRASFAGCPLNEKNRCTLSVYHAGPLLLW